MLGGDIVPSPSGPFLGSGAEDRGRTSLQPQLIHVDYFEAYFGAETRYEPSFREVGKLPGLFLSGAVVETIRDVSPMWMSCSMAKDKRGALLVAARIAGCTIPGTLDDERHAKFRLALSFGSEAERMS